MSAAIQAADADSGADAVGIDRPAAGFGRRLIRAVLRNVASATTHAAVCRLAAVVAARLGVRLEVGSPVAHDADRRDPLAAQARDERERIRRSRTFTNSFATPASQFEDGVREAHMADRLATLAAEGAVVAVVGIEHLDPLAERFDGEHRPTATSGFGDQSLAYGSITPRIADRTATRRRYAPPFGGGSIQRVPVYKPIELRVRFCRPSEPKTSQRITKTSRPLVLSVVNSDEGEREESSSYDNTRRQFVAGSVGVVGGIAAGGALSGSALAQEETPDGEDDAGGENGDDNPEEMFEDDVAILNYALTLEYLEASFYRQGLDNIGEDDLCNCRALSEESDLRDRVFGELQTIQAQEEAHVETLTTAIEDLGGTPIEEPEFDFGVRVEYPMVFLGTAVLLEDVGVSAYAGAAPFIESEDLVPAALGIHSVEARHASFLRTLMSRTGFPNVIDEARTKSEVLELASPFIVDDPDDGDTDEPEETETPTDEETETPAGNETETPAGNETTTPTGNGTDAPTGNGTTSPTGNNSQ